eukprot:TRINITY_DN17862_c0_g1_i2.p3 TRINITY_DN17862_c0_g1~~TRINITY_DN17862_c0_g1_i2.p3  ORF type:complete len:126 (+),score=1.88 TRINITY_DN17862_c0_g1_i2:530-907(+)
MQIATGVSFICTQTCKHCNTKRYHTFQHFFNMFQAKKKTTTITTKQEAHLLIYGILEYANQIDFRGVSEQKQQKFQIIMQGMQITLTKAYDVLMIFCQTSQQNFIRYCNILNIHEFCFIKKFELY